MENYFVDVDITSVGIQTQPHTRGGIESLSYSDDKIENDINWIHAAIVTTIVVCFALVAAFVINRRRTRGGKQKYHRSSNSYGEDHYNIEDLPPKFPQGSSFPKVNLFPIHMDTTADIDFDGNGDSYGNDNSSDHGNTGIEMVVSPSEMDEFFSTMIQPSTVTDNGHPGRRMLPRH